MWDLLHAWREWLAGHDTTELRVFGIVVLWWGRLGKTLEFLGGLTVVIDILGRTRMEAFHTHLRNRRLRVVSTIRRTGRRRSERWVPARLVHPPGLIAFHRVGTIALLVFVVYWRVAGTVATQVVAKLSLAFGAFVFGVPLGELSYVISLVLLNGLVAAALHLLASSETTAIAKLTALHATLLGWRAQLRARWQGERIPATGPPPPPPKEGYPPGLRAFVIAGALVTGFLMFATAHYQDASPHNDPTPIFVVVVTIAVGAFLGGIVLGGGGYLVCLLLLEGLVVTTLGQLKTSAGLESRLKWIGLVLFVIGFSMDLLSS
jgi:hypothetical protein